jgi:hypothetical protein
MPFVHGLKIALVYFKANHSECQERLAPSGGSQSELNEGVNSLLKRKDLEIHIELTRRDALGASINVQQQPEFSVCFCPRGVIVDKSNLTSFFGDFPYRGRSAIVTLQGCRE